MSTVDSARSKAVSPRGRDRLRLSFVALLCLLFGTACLTSTVVTEVVQKGPGVTFIGQSTSVEFNQGVWNALEPSDRSQMGGVFDSLKAQGWKVSSQDGGRIQTASFDPVSLADLGAKGWTISVSNTGKGNVTTAKWSPGSIGSTTGGSGSSGNGVQDIVVTIDETDPQQTHYKYQTSVVVKLDTSQTSGSSSTSSCGDDVWCAAMHKRSLRRKPIPSRRSWKRR